MVGKGLFAVYTGEGKGKTTAALGLSFRALGHNHRVCFIQFIKGKLGTGEALAAKKHSPLLEFHVLGRGFVKKEGSREEDIKAARDAWAFAKSIISKNEHQVVILDELTYLLRYNILTVEEVLEVVCNRPDSMHIVVTGRYAPEEMLHAADLVSEVKAIKHPYGNGIKAQKGFEF